MRNYRSTRTGKRKRKRERAVTLRACFARCLLTRLTLVSLGYGTSGYECARRIPASSARSYLVADYAEDPSFPRDTEDRGLGMRTSSGLRSESRLNVVVVVVSAYTGNNIRRDDAGSPSFIKGPRARARDAALKRDQTRPCGVNGRDVLTDDEDQRRLTRASAISRACSSTTSGFDGNRDGERLRARRSAPSVSRKRDRDANIRDRPDNGYLGWLIRTVVINEIIDNAARCRSRIG